MLDTADLALVLSPGPRFAVECHPPPTYLNRLSVASTRMARKGYCFWQPASILPMPGLKPLPQLLLFGEIRISYLYHIIVGTGRTCRGALQAARWSANDGNLSLLIVYFRW
jgi:hypothetical protein